MSERTNKRRERTLELKRRQEYQMLNEIVANNIEEHNFQKLVKLGIIRQYEMTA